MTENTDSEMEDTAEDFNRVAQERIAIHLMEFKRNLFPDHELDPEKVWDNAPPAMKMDYLLAAIAKEGVARSHLMSVVVSLVGEI